MKLKQIWTACDKLKLISYVLCALLGFLLANAGIFITNWHCWAILVTSVVYGVVENLRGYADGRNYEGVK